MGKLKIKKGDNVKILAGTSKGEVGRIVRVIPKMNRVVVEGVTKKIQINGEQKVEDLQHKKQKKLKILKKVALKRFLLMLNNPLDKNLIKVNS